MEIEVLSVSQALACGLDMLFHAGQPENSRNGPVLVAPEPAMTTYTHPTRRVIFSPLRDANPFFHMMEALWMLAGKNDLAFPLMFNKRFKEYSDDGKVLAGAYGFRWRKYFGRDQLDLIIRELKANPESRRAVLTMWSPNDLGGTGRDLPCNTQIYFDCRGGKLNMTVTNRSNDALWGAFGANAVHFSVLLEYMAAAIGIPIGLYRQFSNNLHVYTDILSAEKARTMCEDLMVTDYYLMEPEQDNFVEPRRLNMTGQAQWDKDLARFMATPDVRPSAYGEPFFAEVAYPMYRAWEHRTHKESEDMAREIRAQDWGLACLEWLQRRHK